MTTVVFLLQKGQFSAVSKSINSLEKTLSRDTSETEIIG